MKRVGYVMNPHTHTPSHGLRAIGGFFLFKDGPGKWKKPHQKQWNPSILIKLTDQKDTYAKGNNKNRGTRSNPRRMDVSVCTRLRPGRRSFRIFKPRRRLFAPNPGLLAPLSGANGCGSK